uniref:Uncharacterized protein n=1 Tax=Kalanchoe fedtschenkoi TaxID=63787 RepID=A0A7N0UU52_KALFE
MRTRTLVALQTSIFRRAEVDAAWSFLKIPVLLVRRIGSWEHEVTSEEQFVLHIQNRIMVGVTYQYIQYYHEILNSIDASSSEIKAG